MELFLVFFVGLVGLTSAFSIARQRRLTRRYVLRSFGLVLFVYGLAALLVWYLIQRPQG